MKVILSHVNADFDALASLVAAQKLYPDAVAAISDKQAGSVRRFLALYRDKLDLMPDHRIDWSGVKELVLVDVASLDRIGKLPDTFARDRLRLTVIDHHPREEDHVRADEETIERVGATVTLLLERIRERSLPVTPFEATLFGLGLYSDTGSFAYSTTTHRDLDAAAFLMRHGMNLDLLRRFLGEALEERQQAILNSLLANSREFPVEGLRILVGTHRQPDYEGGLGSVTAKWLDTAGADAAIAVVEMQKRVYLVCRAGSRRIDFRPLLGEWGGGGHAQAGSASIKGAAIEQVLEHVTNSLHRIVSPAVTARRMMSAPVKTIPPRLTIEEAAKLLYRYGHSGFPVEEDGRLVGIISRRDVDKATRHGLGHAPVKAFMSTRVITVGPDASLEEIQNIMIRHNIGRLPVVEDGRIIGIVTRSNVIETLHGDSMHGEAEQERLRQEAEVAAAADGACAGEAAGAAAEPVDPAAGRPPADGACAGTPAAFPSAGAGSAPRPPELSGPAGDSLAPLIRGRLPEPTVSLLQEIGGQAGEAGVSAFLVGGVVRDLLLGLPNEDVDVSVEGDGIAFARRLADRLGGDVTVHGEFGTATWTAPSGARIDIASSRLEYYDHPAALPRVEFSRLMEDLARRDFTINALAVCLNEGRFGRLVDPHGGLDDLRRGIVRVLHNLSFVEDPTRIIRAVRFELRFAFTMDEQTERLALASAEQLGALSAARIGHELDKLFVETSPARAIRRLQELGFWSGLGVREGAGPSCLAHAERLERIFAALPNERPGWFFWFLLPFFHADQLGDAGRYALARGDRKLVGELAGLIGLMKSDRWTRARTAGDLHPMLRPYSAHALLIAAAASPRGRERLLIAYLRRRASLPAYLAGDDLIRLGLTPGPAFARILAQHEAAVLDGRIRSREQALEWLKSFRTSGSETE